VRRSHEPFAQADGVAEGRRQPDDDSAEARESLRCAIGFHWSHLDGVLRKASPARPGSRYREIPYSARSEGFPSKRTDAPPRALGGGGRERRRDGVLDPSVNVQGGVLDLSPSKSDAHRPRNACRPKDE
jgi:hypothetical protein